MGSRAEPRRSLRYAFLAETSGSSLQATSGVQQNNDKHGPGIHIIANHSSLARVHSLCFLAMHASAFSNVARRRLVHGAAIQSAAASTSATSISPASTVHGVPNVPLDASRSRKVVRDSNKDMTFASREASRCVSRYLLQCGLVEVAQAATDVIALGW